MKKPLKQIKLPAKPISKLLVLQWYKNTRILDKVPGIASKIDKTLLYQNYANHILGQIICDHGNLINIFNEFLDNSDIGKLLENREFSKLNWEVRRRSVLIIRNDVAKHLKASKWWKNRKPGLDQEKKKYNIIRKVMKH